MTHHIILGAGPAGVTAAETLRKTDPQSNISIVDGEAGQPYSRMALPYVLANQIDEDGTKLRASDTHYTDLNIEHVHGRASKIDTSAGKLHLESGDAYDYDNLLIATGATPIVPPIEGIDNPRVHTCWTLEDARNVAAHLHEGEPVVLIGAGFIGSIILEALHARGVNLTVVERGERMVPRMMDEIAGNMLKDWCEAKGIRILTGTTVQAIRDGGEKTVSVETDTGEHLPAELVVLAAGVKSNIDFLDGSGIETDQGIIVDEHMRSSAPNVYAAGDCAQGLDIMTGKKDVLAVQPVAVEHARTAALNMAGKPTPFRGSLNMNVLDTLGLVSSSFGLWHGVDGGDSARSVHEDTFKYLRLEFNGNKLVGAQGVGHTEAIGMARGMIQTGLDLSSWKDTLMRDPQRLAEAYVATSQGIADPYRATVSTPV